MVFLSLVNFDRTKFCLIVLTAPFLKLRLGRWPSIYIMKCLMCKTNPSSYLYLQGVQVQSEFFISSMVFIPLVSSQRLKHPFHYPKRVRKWCPTPKIMKNWVIGTLIFNPKSGSFFKENMRFWSTRSENLKMSQFRHIAAHFTFLDK